MTATPKIHRPTAPTLLALAALAVITAGCGTGAVRKDVAAADGTVQAPAAAPRGKSDTFTDPRDGRVYRTVKIGNQRWMAEDLKYKTGASWCYDEKDKCRVLGLNYNWYTALTACPAGWRLPGAADWDTLLSFVDPDYDYESNKGIAAGKKLKAKSGWDDYEGRSGNGTDEYGFSALPNGSDAVAGLTHGKSRNWWSATEGYKKRGTLHARSLHIDNEGRLIWGIGRGSPDNWRNAVRCIEGSAAGDARSYVRPRSFTPAEPTVGHVQAAAASGIAGVIFTDPRDGQKYRTVKIGSLTWMAQNLNFETGHSSCFAGEDPDCAKFGRFYAGRDVLKACPAGWRVPDDEDWDNLAVAAGGRRTGYGDGTYYWKGAGKKLKSKVGWNNNLNGTDDFGFSALPCGFLGDFDGGVFAGSYGSWWSVTKGGDGAVKAEIRKIDDGDDLEKNYGGWNPLRCVKGPEASR